MNDPAKKVEILDKNSEPLPAGVILPPPTPKQWTIIGRSGSALEVVIPVQTVEEAIKHCNLDPDDFLVFSGQEDAVDSALARTSAGPIESIIEGWADEEEDEPEEIDEAEEWKKKSERKPRRGF